MNEQEQQQNYVEDQLLILNGLNLLNEKMDHQKKHTKEPILLEHYESTIKRIKNLKQVTNQNINNGKPK